MISPSYSMTATERVLPRLALDFTTATLDPRVTFTRTGNTATVTNSSGVIVGINADLPRFDYNPTTLICNGLLIEESRTNVLLNSLIDGSVLGTQIIVVTAAARTLSFYGTGQIVLSGAASATVTGTGNYPTRTILTFTPSVGALTLTVTGTVRFAQLELGSFATSFIPTTASQVTRTADVATMTGTNFIDWFNASEGTFVANSAALVASGYSRAVQVSDNTTSNFISVTTNTSQIRTGGAFQASFASGGSVVAGQYYQTSLAYKLNDCASATNGGTTLTDTSVTLPTVNQMVIGGQTTTNIGSGYIKKIMYWPSRLTNAEVQAFSKQG